MAGPTREGGFHMSQPVLAVDLDGSLSRSDTLYEALFAHLAKNPGHVLRPVGWLGRGKAGFKRALADHSLADPATLPLNETVIARIKAAREAGQRVVLVSAADQRQVTAVADHLQLFDEAHGSDGNLNLSGAAKAVFLVDRFGSKGFDYIGDAPVDLAVWAEARRAITVGASPGLRAKVDALGVETEHLSPPATGRAQWQPYLRALRPHQWVKNILVFVPFMAANDSANLPAALAAFVAFSLLASSVYLMNDLLDLGADRAHPRKRNRPFAAAQVPLAHGLIMAPALILGAVLIALVFTTPLFLGVLTLYYIGNIAYSFVLKRKLIIDVWTLGGLYTARILGGGAATGIVLSPWLLGFSMFLFLSLATVKRQAELMDTIRRGKGKSAGRAYHTEDVPVLQAMAFAAGFGAVVLFALYLDSEAVTALFPASEYLWLVCALLLYWISRMVMFAHRGRMTDDPIIFALRDRGSLTAIGLSALAILMARLL